MKRTWLSTIDYRFATFIAAILLFGLTSGCGEETAEEIIVDRQDADALIRLSDAEIRGLDPQKVSDLAAIRVARDQFEGLTRFNGKGQAEAGLAQSWSIGADGKVWTFTLRPALQFSDGQPLSATIFESVWQRLNAAETASPHTALFAPINTIEAIAPNIVRVTLNAPYPALPALLAHPAMAALPMHRITASADQWTNDRPLVTSGPYQAAQWILNDRLLLQANPNWYRGSPAIARIMWKPSDDTLSGMRQILGGGADIASDYPANRHQWLKDNYPKYVRLSDYLGTYYFAFNTRRPPFDNPDVRRALSLAVDRHFLTDKIIGLGNIPANLVVPPQLWQSYTPNLPANLKMSERRKTAKKLLKKAGYTAQNPLRFDIRINTSREHKRMAAAMAAMWAQLPVEASILNSEASLHFASLRRGDFALARSGWIADLPTPENFLSVHIMAAGPSNYSGYDDPQYTALLEQAAAMKDPEAREKTLYQAAQKLANDAPILPLYYYTARSLVSLRVDGWHDNSLNIHPSADLKWQDLQKDGAQQ